MTMVLENTLITFIRSLYTWGSNTKLHLVAPKLILVPLRRYRILGDGMSCKGPVLKKGNQALILYAAAVNIYKYLLLSQFNR